MLTSSNDSQSKSLFLDKAERPEEIDIWLKNGRKFNAMPNLTNSSSVFGAAWVKWWAHLQPEWRGKGPVFNCEVPEDATWTELQKGGPNGFFLILLSYCWWGSAVLDDEGNEIEPFYSEWVKSLTDIEWVLVTMVETLECSLKRGREAEEDEHNTSPVSKRCVFLNFCTHHRS